MMKIISLCITLLTMSFAASAGDIESKADLVGTWVNWDDSPEGTVTWEFFEDGTFEIVVDKDLDGNADGGFSGQWKLWQKNELRILYRTKGILKVDVLYMAPLTSHLVAMKSKNTGTTPSIKRVS